jgi:hypothetical protein
MLRGQRWGPSQRGMSWCAGPPVVASDGAGYPGRHGRREREYRRAARHACAVGSASARADFDERRNLDDQRADEEMGLAELPPEPTSVPSPVPAALVLIGVRLMRLAVPDRFENLALLFQRSPSNRPVMLSSRRSEL